MIKIDIVTVFPEMFDGVLGKSMIKRGREKGIVKIEVHNLRKWADDKYRTIDNRPYSGGPGMLLRVDVVDRAVTELRQKSSKVILLDTKGKMYNQSEAKLLAEENHLILIAPHYEGIDHRVHEHIADEIYCIGPYVLSGGEIPTMAVVDSVVRLIPGVLGNPKSLTEESFEKEGEIEYPQYTRPEEYKGWKVPGELLSGDPKIVAKWRNSQGE